MAAAFVPALMLLYQNNREAADRDAAAKASHEWTGERSNYGLPMQPTPTGYSRTCRRCGVVPYPYDRPCRG